MPKVSKNKRSALSAIASTVYKPGLFSTALKKNGPEQKLVDLLRKEYDANRNKNNAASMKKYLRGQFEFFGLRSPERRAVEKQVLAKSPELTKVDEVRQTLLILFQQEEREFQLFSIDFGAKNLKILIGPDTATSLASLDCVKKCIETKSWWDTVDMLASKVVGGLVAAHPFDLGPVMDKWIRDENMWVRRTAILHQLSFNKNTDKDKLYRYSLLCCHEKDFFIRKAIGWALRNYFRFDPSSVKTFVKQNEEKLSPLSIKEALKHA